MANAILKRISVLERDIKFIKNKNEAKVSDKVATVLIWELIKELKHSGVKKTNPIDLHFRTRLPFEQINKIMDGFEKEGKVRGNI